MQVFRFLLFVYQRIRVFALLFLLFPIILLHDYTTIHCFVYSFIGILVISSGFYFALLKLIKNCIEIPIILIYDYKTIRPFVYSCIRVFAILFLLFSDYTIIRLYYYTTKRLFVVSCIGIFEYQCIRNFVFTISLLYNYTIILLYD